MSLLSRLMTRLSVTTVRRALQSASPDKLVRHYNIAQQAYRLTDDVREQAALAALQQDILSELSRRGLVKND